MDSAPGTSHCASGNLYHSNMDSGGYVSNRRRKRFKNLINCLFFPHRRSTLCDHILSPSQRFEHGSSQKINWATRTKKRIFCSTSSLTRLPTRVRRRPGIPLCLKRHASPSKLSLVSKESYKHSLNDEGSLAMSLSLASDVPSINLLPDAQEIPKQCLTFVNAPTFCANVPVPSSPLDDNTSSSGTPSVVDGNLESRRISRLNLSKVNESSSFQSQEPSMTEAKLFGLSSWTKLPYYLYSLGTTLTPRAPHKIIDSLTPRDTQYKNGFDTYPGTHVQNNDSDERLFRPTANGMLITQLGTGPLSRRVFIARSPTRLNENVITPHFVQTQYNDLLAFCDKLNSSSRSLKKGFLKTMPTEIDPDPPRSFWPRVLIWDLAMNRPGLASEFPKLNKLTLTFRVLDVGSPTLRFVTALCSSLLFWLNVANGRPAEETYALISYYEADSVFLSLLGCILVALDSESGYPIDTPHICRVLSDASRFVDNAPLSKVQIAGPRPSRFLVGGVLSWLPLNFWRPSSIRLLHHFHRVCDTRQDPIVATPYRLKSIFINNFLGPAEHVVVEVYQVYDLALVDGRTQRHRRTQQALLARCKQRGDTKRENAEEGLENAPSAASSSSVSSFDRESSETILDSKLPHTDSVALPDDGNGNNANVTQHRHPWSVWKRRNMHWYMNTVDNKDPLEKKKTSLTKRTLRATKRFFMPRKKESEYRGSHLLGPYGFVTKSIAPEDGVLQLRLAADNKDYTVMMSETLPNGRANLVLNFVQESNQPTPLAVDEKNSLILSGDVILVLRQMDYKYQTKLTPKIAVSSSTPTLQAGHGEYGPHTERKTGYSSSSVWTSSSVSRFVDPCRHNSTVSAVYTFHTGFLMQGADSPDTQFRRIRREEFDISPSYSHVIPDDMEMYLVCEPLNFNRDGSSLQPRASKEQRVTLSQSLTSCVGHSSSATHLSENDESVSQSKPLQYENSLRYTQSDVADEAITNEMPFLSNESQQVDNAVRQSKTLLATNFLKVNPEAHRHDHSHEVQLVLERLRWNSVSAQPPDSDIETFLRHHTIVPRESLLVSLLQEGYSLFAAAAALKIAENDAWNALQFLLRFPNLDVFSHEAPGNTRYVSSNALMSPFSTFNKDAFDFGNLEHLHTSLLRQNEKPIAPSVPIEAVPIDLNVEQGVTPVSSSSLCVPPDSPRQSSEASSYPLTSSTAVVENLSAFEECTEPTSTLRFPGRPPGLPPAIVAKVLEVSRFPGTAPAPAPHTNKDGSVKKTSTREDQSDQDLLHNKPSSSRRRVLPPTPTPPRPPKAPPLGRKIYWKPLRAANIQGTIFEELASKRPHVDESSRSMMDLSSLVDSTHLNRLFVKATVPKVSGSQTLDDTTTKQYYTLLDSKRAQNISIVLARMTLLPEVIAGKLRRLDPEGLTLDELDRTEAILLSPEEDTSFTSYFEKGGIKDNLRLVPEQRLVSLRPSATFRLINSIAVLRFQATYAGIVETMRQSFDILRKATREVRESQKFRQVLSVVLRWGNYINYGVASDELYIRGFTLGSLLKLTEFKTTIDPSITSLHYLAANMLKTAPGLHLEELRNDMPTIGAAAKLSGEVLSMNMDFLQQGRTYLRSELDVTSKTLAALKNLDGRKIAERPQIPQDELEDRLTSLKRFEACCNDVIQSVGAEYLEVNESAYKTCRFFGDDFAHQTDFKTTFRSEGFFQTLNTFIRKFHVCCEEVLRHPHKYEVLLRFPRAEASPANESSTVNVPPPTNEAKTFSSLPPSSQPAASEAPAQTLVQRSSSCSLAHPTVQLPNCQPPDVRQASENQCEKLFRSLSNPDGTESLFLPRISQHPDNPATIKSMAHPSSCPTLRNATSVRPSLLPCRGRAGSTSLRSDAAPTRVGAQALYRMRSVKPQCASHSSVPSSSEPHIPASQQSP